MKKKQLMLKETGTWDAPSLALRINIDNFICTRQCIRNKRQSINYLLGLQDVNHRAVYGIRRLFTVTMQHPKTCANNYGLIVRMIICVKAHERMIDLLSQAIRRATRKHVLSWEL